MSNIKIGYASNYNAYSVTSSAPVESLGDVYNYSRGARSVITSKATVDSGFIVTYDFGSAVSLDHYFIARADRLQDASTTTVRLDRSSDGSSWTSQYADSSFASATLKCPTSTDYLETFTETSAYRYWRAYFIGSSSLYPHSKHCFGVGFDFGDDPVSVIPGKSFSSYSNDAATGDVNFLRLRKPQNTYRMIWRGITNAKLVQAQTSFLMFEDMPLYLYTTNNHEILNNYKVVQVALYKKPVMKKLSHNYNEVTLEFIEQLG